MNALMITPRVKDFVDGLQGIADFIGADAARAISTHFGGTKLYVPRNWREDIDINVIGVEEAQKLCRHFGAERIDVPLMPFTAEALRRFVSALRAENRSNAEIARAIGVSWRTVTRMGQNAPPLTKGRVRVSDERQSDLEAWLKLGKSSA
jgi:hypothetical protein